MKGNLRRLLAIYTALMLILTYLIGYSGSAAAEAVQSEITLESEDLVVEHTLPEYPVTLWLDCNDEEQAVIDTYLSGLQTYTEEMLIKFVLGQAPISEFDEFVENVKSMGLDEVLAAYESAYNRVK